MFEKRLVILFSLVWRSVCVEAAPAHENPSHSTFPKYPQTRTRPSASSPVHASGTQKRAVAITGHSDTYRNHVTDDHLQRVDFAKQRTETVMKPNDHIRLVATETRNNYVKNFQPVFEHRRNDIEVIFMPRYQSIFIQRPVYLVRWHEHHFFYGFEYGFYPCRDISIDFYNPQVRWMFSFNLDPDLNRRWYKDEYDAYPQLQQPFAYPDVWFPTENIHQLLLGVSAMTPEKQAHFHTAMSLLTKNLAQSLANGLDKHVTLSKGDILLTHYEILGYDEGVTLVGSISFANQIYNFQGLLDLDYPSNSDIFVPVKDTSSPTEEQTRQLDFLNAKIDQIRGLNPPDGKSFTGPIPPGDVQADPKKI